MESSDDIHTMLAQILDVQGQMLSHQKITAEVQKTLIDEVQILKSRWTKVENSLGKLLAAEEAKEKDSNQTGDIPSVEKMQCIWHLNPSTTSRRSLNFKAKECGTCSECKAHQAKRKIKIARKPVPSAVVKRPPESEETAKVIRKRIEH